MSGTLDTGHGAVGAGARTYVVVAAFLLVLTVMEVWIFYIPALARVLVPVLLVLSALKFALVAMFYMHLKFDHAWFSYMFVGPLIIAIGLAVALLWLFGHIGTTGVPPRARGDSHGRSALAPGSRARPGGPSGGLLVAVGPLRRRRRWGPPPARGRLAAFVAATAVLAGALLGPLAEWAEHVRSQRTWSSTWC